MLVSLIASAAAAQGTPTDRSIRSMHSVGTLYSRITYETACPSMNFAVRFSNRPEGKNWGRVEEVRIGGFAVPAIAKQLTQRAAGRLIVRIGVLNCGIDEQQPEFHGSMETETLQSQRMSLTPNSYFTVRKTGNGWGLTFKGPQQAIEPTGNATGATARRTPNVPSQ